MFDLIAYIRQYLPPQRRTPTAIGFVRVLFFPVVYVFTFLDDLRRSSLRRAKALGQVGVLESLLNAAGNDDSGDGPFYIVEGNFKDHDFQVVVPEGTPADVLGQLQYILKSHVLPSKRWKITTNEGLNWGLSGGTSAPSATIRFVAGFPREENGLLRVSVAPAGTYAVQIWKNGVEQAPQNFNFASLTTIFEYPNEGTLDDGIYLVAVSDGTNTIENSVSYNSRVCDLAFDDANPNVTTPGFVFSYVRNPDGSLQTDVNGNIAIKFDIRLYSAYPGIGPFDVYIQKADGTAINNFQKTQGAFSFVQNFMPGNYRLRVEDKDGCRTIWRPFLIEGTPSVCDLAFSITNGVGVEVVNNRYRLSCTLVSGRSNLTPYRLTVTAANGTILYNDTATTNPIIALLPEGTAAGQVSVIATDKFGCQTPVRAVSLPDNSQTSSIRIGYKRDGNTKSLEVYSLVPDAGNYVVFLTPLDGQAGAVTSQRPLVAVANNLYGVAYNRKYQYLPAFAGGIDVANGRWRITVQKAADATITKSVEVVLTGSNDEGDLTPTGTTQEPTGPTTQPVVVVGDTKFVKSNPSIMYLVWDWNSEGKARLRDIANPGVSGNTYYFISGGPAVSSLPSGYVFAPGDLVVIYKVISNNPNVYDSEWIYKSYWEILFGNPPSNQSV